MKKYVIKIGTATITTNSSINNKRIENLALDCKYLLDKGNSITIVTSGAMASGRRKLNTKYKENETMAEKQMYSAVGQPLLMEAYISAFGRYKIKTGQFLVTNYDFSNKESLENLRRTHSELLKRKAIPIFNENDPLATEEISFGDNDLLAAHLTTYLNQDILIILTNTEGILKKGKTVWFGNSFSVKDYDVINHKIKNKESIGGLASKLKAAEIVTKAGKECTIAHVRHPLTDIISKKSPSTIFIKNWKIKKNGK